MARTVRALSGFDPSIDFLVDMRELEHVDYDGQDFLGHMMRLQSERREMPRAVRYAALMDEDNVEAMSFFRIYQGYAALAPNLEAEFFGDAGAAGAWLGLKRPAEDILAEAAWVALPDAGRDEGTNGRE